MAMRTEEKETLQAAVQFIHDFTKELAGLQLLRNEPSGHPQHKQIWYVSALAAVVLFYMVRVRVNYEAFPVLIFFCFFLFCKHYFTLYSSACNNGLLCHALPHRDSSTTTTFRVKEWVANLVMTKDQC